MSETIGSLDLIRNRLFPKREADANTLPMVFVKYNVPKAIRSLGMNDTKGQKSFTAPAKLGRINLTLKSASQKRALEFRKSKLI